MQQLIINNTDAIKCSINGFELIAHRMNEENNGAFIFFFKKEAGE